MACSPLVLPLASVSRVSCRKFPFCFHSKCPVSAPQHVSHKFNHLFDDLSPPLECGLHVLLPAPYLCISWAQSRAEHVVDTHGSSLRRAVVYTKKESLFTYITCNFLSLKLLTKRFFFLPFPPQSHNTSLWKWLWKCNPNWAVCSITFREDQDSNPVPIFPVIIFLDYVWNALISGSLEPQRMFSGFTSAGGNPFLSKTQWSS